MMRALVLALLFAASPVLAGERYAINMNDGSVAVMELVQGTAQEAVDKWTPSQKAKVLSITKVDPADLPTDRALRDAWTFDKATKKFGTDMTKAKEIWTKKLLSDRRQAMKEAQDDADKADGLGDAQAKSAAQAKLAKAQKSIPLSQIEAAQTPEELKAITLQ